MKSYQRMVCLICACKERMKEMIEEMNEWMYVMLLFLFAG